MIIIKFPAARRLLGFRFGGSGLGNLLFVAGRAVKEFETSGEIGVVSTPLLQFNIGPLVRWESDLRLYWKYIFCPYRRSPRWHEVFASTLLPPDSLCFVLRHLFQLRDVKVVEGLGRYFNEFIGYDDAVRLTIMSQLRRWAKPSGQIDRTIRLASGRGDPGYIVVHVRGKDFPGNWRVELDWYERAYRHVTNGKLEPPRVFVITDDTNLASNVERVLIKQGIAAEKIQLSNVEALLFMASANCVIGNNSTFSAWGAYLGAGKLVSKFITAYEAPTSKSYLKVIYVD